MIEGITAPQRAALAALTPCLDDGTYLAGGVAIAVQLHHRTSLDLDLFVPHDFDADRLAERLAVSVPGFRVVGRARGTLHGELLACPVSVLSYRYALLTEPHAELGLPLPVASLDDLACMKLSAIAGRGAAKDFWDLSTLLAHGVGAGNLATLLELYLRKFPVEDVGHVVRSLAYFGDADAEPLPRGLAAESWAAIKLDVARRVKAL